MAKLPSIEEMAKDVAQRAMQEITINDMPLEEFIVKVDGVAEFLKSEKSLLRYQERCCVWMSEILNNLCMFLRKLRLSIKLLPEKYFNNLLKDEGLEYEQRLYLVYFRYM